MEIIGIRLRKPTFSELTASAVMAVGVWMAGLGLWRASGGALDRSDAGAALLVLMWACCGARLGVQLDKGGRHLMAHLFISAVLLSLYQVGCVLLG